MEFVIVLSGVTKVAWDVSIVQDDEEEKNEKFRVMLKSPANAILGERSRVNVQIVDLRQGKCISFVTLRL